MSARIQEAPTPDEKSLLGLLAVVGRRKATIARSTVIASTLALIVALLWPKTFTGETRVLPPQQNQSGAAAMLGQLAAGLGGLAGSGLKNSSDLYIGMLRSRGVADALVERFGLKEYYGKEYLADARKRLAQDSRFLTDKSGIILIEVDAREPKLAADLANAYVEELYRLTNTLAVTEAAQRRVFFEQQLNSVKSKLAEAEVRLREAINTGGLASVDAQGRATLETGARLRAQISAKEVQIGAMQAYSTSLNPDFQRAKQELSALREELSRLESGVAAAGQGAEAGGQVGVRGLDSIRLLREVKYQEVLFELMSKQYELARVDEARDAPLVQVLDRAAPPEKKSGPPRALIVLGAALVGLLASTMLVLWQDALRGEGAEALRTRLADLREAWRVRSGGGQR